MTSSLVLDLFAHKFSCFHNFVVFHNLASNVNLDKQSCCQKLGPPAVIARSLAKVDRICGRPNQAYSSVDSETMRYITVTSLHKGHHIFLFSRCGLLRLVTLFLGQHLSNRWALDILLSNQPDRPVDPLFARDMQSAGNHKELPDSTPREPLMNGQTQRAPRPWQPGGLERIPLRAFLAMFGAACCVIASVVIFFFSKA